MRASDTVQLLLFVLSDKKNEQYHVSRLCSFFKSRCVSPPEYQVTFQNLSVKVYKTISLSKAE